MYVKKEAPFTMRDSAKTLAFLCKAEKELKRKRLLSRLLPPVGTVLFMFNLLIASVNTIRFACGEELSKVLDEMPVLPALADGMQGCFSSWGGVIAMRSFRSLPATRRRMRGCLLNAPKRSICCAATF